MAGTYPTTTPKSTDRSAGAPVSNPQSITETSFSTSDTEKLGLMFPLTPYLKGGLNQEQMLAAANAYLHPAEQTSISYWGGAEPVLFNFQASLDQTAEHDVTWDTGVPKNGYAPYPAPHNAEVQPETPAGYAPNQPTENLKKPKVEGAKVFKTIGAVLEQGINVHK